MDNYDQLNEILVYLFDHALDIERNFLKNYKYLLFLIATGLK